MSVIAEDPNTRETQAVEAPVTTHEPVLITEQEVMFASAASVVLPPPRRWSDRIRLLFTWNPGPRPRGGSYYDTSMSNRERYRL